MSPSASLTRKDARKLFLKQQGLLHRHDFGRGRAAVARTVDQLGYIQIDTISVIKRAHEHVLSTRVEGATARHLDRLARDREIFEYWSHAAAFLPFEDYRFCLPVMRGWQSARDCDRKLARDIVARIRTEGPLSSRQFEDSRRGSGNGWWDWKPAKQVLEHLFLSGELMISHREGFQKVYDLPENIIPSHINTACPDEDEWARFIVRRMTRALGVATEKDIGYARPTISRLAKINLKQPIARAITDLCESGELVRVSVEGDTLYSTPQVLAQLPLKATKQHVRLLSPFDNLVINRERTRTLFGFDYLLECYVPEKKRKYGYFCLPLLYGDELIGRLDAKADRKRGVFEVKSLHLEAGVKSTDRLYSHLAEGIRRFATEHSCQAVVINRSAPANIKPVLEKSL